MTYTRVCNICGSPWEGYGNQCNACRTIRTLEAAATKRAEHAEREAERAERDAKRAAEYAEDVWGEQTIAKFPGLKEWLEAEEALKPKIKKEPQQVKITWKHIVEAIPVMIGTGILFYILYLLFRLMFWMWI